MLGINSSFAPDDGTPVRASSVRVSTATTKLSGRSKTLRMLTVRVRGLVTTIFSIQTTVHQAPV